MSAKTIEQVQQDYTEEWMGISGVVGTAIGQHKGKPCILVLTSDENEQIKEGIPDSVEGYPVIVQYAGEIKSR